jgi:hypothetical protein
MAKRHIDPPMELANMRAKRSVQSVGKLPGCDRSVSVNVDGYSSELTHPLAQIDLPLGA